MYEGEKVRRDRIRERLREWERGREGGETDRERERQRLKEWEEREREREKMRGCSHQSEKWTHELFLSNGFLFLTA